MLGGDASQVTIVGKVNQVEIQFHLTNERTALQSAAETAKANGRKFGKGITWLVKKLCMFCLQLLVCACGLPIPVGLFTSLITRDTDSEEVDENGDGGEKMDDGEIEVDEEDADKVESSDLLKGVAHLISGRPAIGGQPAKQGSTKTYKTWKGVLVREYVPWDTHGAVRCVTSSEDTRGAVRCVPSSGDAPVRYVRAVI
ncbi:hypothetical protein CYMTET_28924 [Cymbomonas tetramitiformis]|uniref:Uncharacterized protein n=1 Tax=Cymbomonas tetramitiformis TaxID=36881 RepID=A0AAE0FNH6_9CHLO|nr:hypothetical protein CYMTET_28924 [Cymbomonas tetramitiformis]